MIPKANGTKRQKLAAKKLLPHALTVAMLACAAVTFAKEGGSVIQISSYWPALLGIVCAAGIVALCIWAVRKSRRMDEIDHVLDWRSLAENIAEAVILLKNDGTILFVNRWASDRDVVVGIPVINLVQESEHSRWNEFISAGDCERNVCKTDTFVMRLPDGSTAHWEIRLSPLENGPHDAEIILCGRDVSDLRLKETTKDVLHKITFAAANMESLEAFVKYIERQLSRIVDTSNFTLAIYNKDSDSYTKFLSRDRSDVCKSDQEKICLKGGLTDYVRRTGKPVLMNEENREQLVSNFGVRQLGDSAACWLGVPLRNRDEVLGVFVVQSYDNPNLYSSSDVDLLSIVAGSIGRALERKSAQTELQRREEKLRLFVDRTPALLWSQDSNARITYASGAALSAVGLDSESLIGKTLCEVAQIGEENLRAKIEYSESGVPVEFSFKLSNRTFEAWIERAGNGMEELAGMTGIALDITERQRAGTELRRFFELSGDLFAVVDNDGVLIRCNEGYINATGYTQEELLNKSTLPLVHPEDEVLAAWAMRELVAGKPLTSIETRIVCKDGTVKWISWSSVLDTEDNLIYSSGKDVTNRREMENALHEREEQLRLFVENSPASLAMFDRDMKYMVVSERWRKDYKLGDTEIIGVSHYEVFPEINDDWKEIHRRCLNGATEQRVRDPFVRLNGSTDWVRWEIKPWHRADGSIGGIMMFTQVITEEVRAELELARSKNLARKVVDASLDSVVVIDAEGLITEWNPQAERDFGYLHDEAVGKPLHELIVPQRFANDHVVGLDRHKRTGQSRILNQILHLPAIRKNGEEFPAEVSICPIQVGEETHFSAFIRDVSERQAREKELQESRHKLKEAQRIAGLGSWEWTAANDEMYVSEEKLKLYDRPDLKLPISFAEFLEIIHPEDRRIFIESHSEVMAGGNACEFEYRIVRPSGEIRYAYSQGEVVRDKNGAVERIFGTTLDITDRVQNEERLRKSEERLALAFDGSSDGFWDWNMLTGECYYSPRIVEWLEYSPQEFHHTVQFWEEMIDPVSLSAYRTALADHIMRRTDRYEVEERLQTKSGKWIWVLARGKVVQFSEDGTPVRAAGTWTNITERKIIEARAAQIGSILDHSVNEVYVIETQSLKIIECNKRARQNTGYSKEELNSLTLPQLTVEWDHSDTDSKLKLILTRQAESVHMQSAHVRKDGTTYPFEMTLQLMEWQDKTVLVAIGSDVTEKVAADQEFQKLNAQLRHNQRLETIGTLAGGIAHDFNNILTPILGYADMAARDLDPGTTTRQDIEQVVQAAYRAKGLVQQILSFSRQGEQTRHPAKLDTLVKEALKLFEVGLPPSIDLVKGVHDVGQVMTDPTMINQILINLCTNGCKAIGDNIGAIHVALERVELSDLKECERLNLPNGAYAKLSVTDSGRGMEPQTMERMFEPFFTTETVGNGTGLGLSVVHGIVESHDGAIDVDSVLNRGTRFSVYLPIHHTYEPVCLPVNVEETAGSEHVLICDDDETILALCKQMLESYGYRVTATADPVDALAKLAKAEPPVSVVVVDDKMPILSGLDVALSAHDYNPAIPVILLSAGQNGEENEECFSKVILKPVEASVLAKSVRKCIDNSNMEKLSHA